MRIHKADLDEWAAEARSAGGTQLVDEFYALVYAEEKRVADNAAWVLTHLGGVATAFLRQHRHELMQEAMTTASPTKCRLLLTLLRPQTFGEEEICTGFLDFCLALIPDTSRPASIRSLAIYLAYSQCKAWPELLQELAATLSLLDGETLLPGMRCARRKVEQAIGRICKTQEL